MKIRLLTSLAGPDGAHYSGEEIEMVDAEAVRYIAHGYAEPVEDVIRTAVLPGAIETADLPAKRRKRG